MRDESPSPPQQQDSILGLSTRELAGLTVDELVSNRVAITMLMHYYKKLVDENNSFKNELNTLRTYVSGYERKKTFASVGSFLLLGSNVLIGFGVNLLTGSNTWAGLAMFIPGVVLIAIGFYFSNKDVG